MREMGLGSVRNVTLAKARDLATTARAALAEGRDPISDKRSTRAALTFSECAEKYLEANRAAWKSAKHAAQWTSTIKTYAGPVLGALPVAMIDVSHIARILDPIWPTKTETASRLRGRIESVLDWATARGYRTGDNPARWRGHLEQLFPKRSKLQKVKHFAALPYGDVASFVSLLRDQDGTAARALEFLILTATRTNETLSACWPDIDLGTCTWTIPAHQMKAGAAHQVPLSARAVQIISELRKELGPLSPTHLFPGMRPGRELSNNAMLLLLARMNRSDLTAHGFRSTFRDWAAETTDFPNEVVEMALAHTISSKSEAAYRRGNLLTKRRALMDAWADFVQGNAARVSGETTEEHNDLSFPATKRVG